MKLWRSNLSIFLLIFVVLASRSFAQDEVIIGYYPSWAVYARNYHVPDIDAAKLTHINYAFANVVNGEVVLGDAYADTDRFYPGDCWDAGCERGSFHQLEILKQQHPHLKTLISVGGWTWSGQFSDAALTEQARNRFATSCAQFVDRWGFDGVDIDWEFPVSGGLNPGRPEDRHNFTLLMRAIRSKLDSLEAAHARAYLLTSAMSASPFTIANYELDSLAAVLDLFNLMTYDFSGPWSAVTNFNSPLYANPADPTPPPHGPLMNGAAAVQAYINAGVPRNKIVLGMAFYGRGFGSVANVNDGLFQPFSGVSPNGTWEPGSFDFWDLRANYISINNYTRRWSDASRVPWLYNSTAQIMITYDDPTSIHWKGTYVLNEGLGGGMFWELSADREHELLAALYQAIRCPQPVLDLTVQRTPGGIRLRFAAEAARAYKIYSTTDPANDCNPDGGADPDWTLSSTLLADSSQPLQWTDNTPLSSFKSYVVTAVCP